MAPSKTGRQRMWADVREAREEILEGRRGKRVSFLGGQGEDGGCGLTWWRLCRRRDRRSGDMDCLVSWEGSISI